MRLLTLALLSLAVCASCLAAPVPMDILTRALTLHKGVKDYTAMVNVQTDVPNMEIPNRTAKVYVKPPDKTYIESGGQFVFIPKRALLFGDVAKDIGRHAKVVLAGAKKLGPATIYTLKIIPTDVAPPKPAPGRPMSQSRPAGAPRIMITVNGTRWTMERVQILAGAKTMATIDFTYTQVRGFWMPTRVAATVNGVPGTPKPGHFAITFSDYQVNTGLTDQFFADKQAKSNRGMHRGPRRRPRPGS